MKNFMAGKNTEEYQPYGNVENQNPEEKTTRSTKKRKEERIRKKRKKKKGKRRRNKNYLLRIFFVLIFVIAVVLFLSSDFFNVDKITIEGVTKYEPETVLEMSKMKIGDNIFTVEDKDGTEKVESLPYVKSTTIKRQLPNEVIYQIEEREPQAAIMYNKEYYIIDEEKIVVDTLAEENSLTIIEDIEVKKTEEGKELNSEEPVTIEKSLEIITVGKKNEFNFSSVTVDIPKGADAEEATCRINITPSLICIGNVEKVISVINKGYLEDVLATLDERKVSRGTITVNDDNQCVFSPEIM